MTGHLSTALLLAACTTARASNVLLSQRLRDGSDTCQPWRVPETERCGYVIEHQDVCYPDGGFQEYIRVHYCKLAGWQWLSMAMLLVLVALLLLVMLVAAERFFCPSLELISDHMRLPPGVAGATLLALGNGAPDVFTQVAAAAHGQPSALSMALSEPLGGGLFVSNVVFGCVVLMSCKQHKVRVRRRLFLKDALFYLAAVATMYGCVWDGQLHVWEAVLLACLYLTYVVTTLVVCRGDEPLHAGMGQHEVPPEDLLGGGIDERSEEVEEEEEGDGEAGRARVAPLLTQPLLAPSPSPPPPVRAVARAASAPPQLWHPPPSPQSPAAGGAEAREAELQCGSGSGSGRAARPAPPASLWHRLQGPVTWSLGFAMPRVGSAYDHRYPRWRASLLPMTMPLLFVACADCLGRVGAAGVAYGVLCGALGSALLWAQYPADAVPRGALKRMFACLAFVQSIALLNACASTLVAACVVLGFITAAPPALLGATVLAWGNSVPDLVANVSMALDGFPTVAITACFASPVFQLLGGMSAALGLGAARSGRGLLPVEVDLPLQVMYGFAAVNLIKYLLLVPLVYRYSLGRSLVAVAFGFYTVYSGVYALVVSGVLGGGGASAGGLAPVG